MVTSVECQLPQKPLQLDQMLYRAKCNNSRCFSLKRGQRNAVKGRCYRLKAEPQLAPAPGHLEMLLL